MYSVPWYVPVSLKRLHRPAACGAGAGKRHPHDYSLLTILQYWTVTLRCGPILATMRPRLVPVVVLALLPAAARAQNCADSACILTSSCGSTSFNRTAWFFGNQTVDGLLAVNVQLASPSAPDKNLVIVNCPGAGQNCHTWAPGFGDRNGVMAILVPAPGGVGAGAGTGVSAGAKSHARASAASDSDGLGRGSGGGSGGAGLFAIQSWWTNGSLPEGPNQTPAGHCLTSAAVAGGATEPEVRFITCG